MKVAYTRNLIKITMSPEMLKICMEFLRSIQQSKSMDWSALSSLVEARNRPFDFVNNGNL